MKNSKQLACFGLLLATLFVNCSKETDPTILFQNDQFTLYKDRVVQGDFEAKVISPTEIASNYQTHASKVFDRMITFKFSINEKDIELPSGQDHTIFINDEHQSPIIKFGTQHIGTKTSKEQYLPENYQYTFRVDFTEVLDQFKNKGFYTAQDGTTIAQKDFKGLYIAGGSYPLSWDFSNLDENGLILKDEDNDGIYTITVNLNPVDVNANHNKTWKLSRDISALPQYSSEIPMVNALYNLSLEESLNNIEADSTLRTGKEWSGVWTRDISYSILLSFGYLQPEISKISLMKKVNRDRIIQDTGSGGAWPVSSDRTTWALAAWEIYKVTGDTKWLAQSFEIIKNSIDDDYNTIYNPTTGLYKGESSFLDWREQTYPKWMDNRDIFVSENLGTNVVHYQTHQILIEMGALLNKDVTIYKERAANIKNGIQKYLWNEKRGYFMQYLYGKMNLQPSDRYETLGEALSILFDVATPDQAKQIIANAPTVAFGNSCIYPQIPAIPPYHNNGIWPFVQSYHNWAAAKANNENALVHGMAAVFRPAALFLTNYENFVAENGDYFGTEINSSSMLWSMAGNMAMVNRVLLGLNFETNGLSFAPKVPQVYGGTQVMKNFKYRNANLTIKVVGFGSKIKSFKLDGNLQERPFVDAAITGNHTIEIELDNQSFEQKNTPVNNHFTNTNPITTLKNNQLSWQNVEGTTEYFVYKNGKMWQKTKKTSIELPSTEIAEYSVSSVDKMGYESFISQPILANVANKQTIIEIEDFTTSSTLPYINYTGKGFVAVTTNDQKCITIPVQTLSKGKYLIDIRYSNGSGAWNTHNKCAIRSLYFNQSYVGAVVMPQRGENEWSDWGYSNSYVLDVNESQNELKITFDNWNHNMNVIENTAMLDHIRLIKIK